MTDFSEYMVDGTSVETVFITHTKCGWEWLSYQEYGNGSVPLEKIIEWATTHDLICDETP